MSRESFDAAIARVRDLADETLRGFMVRHDIRQMEQGSIAEFESLAGFPPFVVLKPLPPLDEESSDA